MVIPVGTVGAGAAPVPSEYGANDVPMAPLTQ